jgi:hypothetical protein
MIKGKINLFSILFFIISIFLLIYIYYKSEIVWNGEMSYFYKQYYFISIFFLTISIFNLLLKKEFQIYINIILLSVIFSFYIFEYYLNYIKLNDESRFSLYSKLKKNNIDITVTVSPKDYLKNNKINFFPISGVSNKKTILCNENGYMAMFDSDRYGFNNPDTEWDSNKIEFLVVGDSFAQGMCVNRPNDISSQIRKKTGLTAINLGYQGNGPLTEYASIIEYGNSKPVKNIIWLYYEGNDLKNLFEEEIKNKHLMKYLQKDNHSQNLILLQKIINLNADAIINTEYEYQKRQNHNKLSRFLKLRSLRDMFNFKKEKFSSEKKYEIDEIFPLLMMKTKNISEKINAKLYFVYLPSYVRYNKKEEFNFYKFEVLKIIKDLNIQIIDIDKLVFKENPLSLFPFKKNGHYTVEGYNRIADAILKSIN